jgi:hypothetical protein
MCGMQRSIPTPKLLRTESKLCFMQCRQLWVTRCLDRMQPASKERRPKRGVMRGRTCSIAFTVSWLGFPWSTDLRQFGYADMATEKLPEEITARFTFVLIKYSVLHLS